MDRADRLARVDRLEERELVAVLVDQVGDAQQGRGPVACRRPAPRALVEGLARGRGRRRDVGGSRLGDLRDRLVVARADRREDRPVRCGHELPADEQRVRLRADERPARIGREVGQPRHDATSWPDASSASSTEAPPWMIAARPRVMAAGSGSRQMLLPIATPAQPAMITAS